jgi:hypothetical protein
MPTIKLIIDNYQLKYQKITTLKGQKFITLSGKKIQFKEVRSDAGEWMNGLPLALGFNSHL